jgi:hypothetical protein
MQQEGWFVPGYNDDTRQECGQSVQDLLPMCVRNRMDTPCSKAPAETQVAVVHNVPPVALGTRSSE